MIEYAQILLKTDLVILLNMIKILSLSPSVCLSRLLSNPPGRLPCILIIADFAISMTAAPPTSIISCHHSSYLMATAYFCIFLIRTNSTSKKFTVKIKAKGA
jgi:hypothetical protein